MTPQEVSQILQDPHAVPDSDDDEDDRERSKVRVSCSNMVLVRPEDCQAWSLLVGYAYAHVCTNLAAIQNNIFPCEYYQHVLEDTPICRAQ